MGYYRNYYGGGTHNMGTVKNTGGCGQESILMSDKINKCKCDSCEECGCDPDICRCNCHTDRDMDMFKMENID